MNNAFDVRGKTCCCVLQYDPQAQVFYICLYGIVFAIVVCIQWNVLTIHLDT